MRCEQCGSENAAGAATCAMCGAAIGAGASAPGVESGWGLAMGGRAPHQPPTGEPPFGQPAVQLPPGVPPGTLLTPGMYRPAKGTPFMQDELASWGTRFLAFLVNGLVKFVLLVVLVGGAVLLPWLLDRGAYHAGVAHDEPTTIATVIVLVGALLGLASGFLYDWLTIARWGAGPGQRVAGIMVRDVSGGPVRSSQAAGRAAAKLLLYTIAGYCLSYLPQVASAITIGVTDRRQAVHEMMSSTISVRRDALQARDMLH